MPVTTPNGIAHMQPAPMLRALRLQNHLVEIAVVANKGRELLQLLLVGDEDVGSLTQRVLTARHTMNGEVQLWTAISTRYDHYPTLLAQWFQHILAKQHQSGNHDYMLRCVVDAILNGCART